MTQKQKSILNRFIKAFVGGATSAMVLVPACSQFDWTTLMAWINLLLLAGMGGGISGFILAIQKYVSWED